MQPNEAIQRIKSFKAGSLTDRISSLEKELCKLGHKNVAGLLRKTGIEFSLLEAAFEIKNLSGQIDVIVHALGILIALPFILEESESIESLSLGAGNTGRNFDLETNKRIAEFKFIDWKGGAESIRQNSLFKDFYELAEANVNKKRYLYVLGLTYPMKFLTGKRNLESVMSKSVSLRQKFHNQYGGRFVTIGEYFEHRRNRVIIADLTKIAPDIKRLTVNT